MKYIILELTHGTKVDKASIIHEEADDEQELLTKLFGENAEPIHYRVTKYDQEFLLMAVLNYRLYINERDFDRDHISDVAKLIMRMINKIDIVYYARAEKQGPEFFILPSLEC